MAIHHHSESKVSRSTGRSACAASAYITGSRVQDTRQGVTFDYGNKSDVVAKGIFCPEDAPDWARSSDTLWNEVARVEDQYIDERFKGHPTDPEKNERSLKARQAAKETAIEANTITIGLQREFTEEQNIKVIHEILNRYYKPRSLVVEWAYHDNKKGNPHAHLMIAPRALIDGEFIRLKCRDFNDVKELRIRRELTATCTNEVALENDINIKVDHRSYKDQGIELTPTQHEGWYARKVLKNESRIVQENKEIRAQNIKLLFEKPEELIKLVSSQYRVVSEVEIVKTIFKIVEGDDKLFHQLRARVESAQLGKEIDTEWLEILYAAPAANANGEKPLIEADRAQIAKDFVGLLVAQNHLQLVGQNIKGETVYSSPELVKTQEDFAQNVATLRAKDTFAVPSKRLENAINRIEKRDGFSFGEEQKEALSALVSQEGITVIEGRAGTGKTTVLEVLKEAYEGEGYRVLGCSFQGRTAEHLEADTGMFSHTLDTITRRWAKFDENVEKLIKEENYTQTEANYSALENDHLAPFQIDEKTVVVVDEAFMVPSHLLHKLVNRAVQKGSKVVLSGDSRQISAFNSWDAGRAVLKETGSVTLEEIRRQKVDWQRNASVHLSRHELWKGYHEYEERGHIHQKGTKKNCIKALAGQYVAHVLEGDFGHKVRETLLLAHTNESVEALNEAVISSLRHRGLLGAGHVISKTYEENKIAIEDIKQEPNYAQNPETLKDLQRLEEIQESLAKKYTFYEGQRVSFTSNDHSGFWVNNVTKATKEGVKNGTQGVLLKVERGYVHVALDDGRTVSFHPLDFSSLSQSNPLRSSFAVTVSKAQGLTVDDVFGLFEPCSANFMYVMGTRHRYNFIGAYGHDTLEKPLSFKEFVLAQERPSFTPLASDYVIDENRRPFYNRVQSYLELSHEVFGLTSTLCELKEGVPVAHFGESESLNLRGLDDAEKRKALMGLGWEKFGLLEAQRIQLAQEIALNIEGHRTFLEMAGLSMGVILEKAGYEDRPLTALERRARVTARQYARLAEKTRTLWKVMSATEEGKTTERYTSFKNLQDQRNALAYKIFKAPDLYRPFLKQEGHFLPAVERHKDDHLRSLYEQSLLKQDKDLVIQMKRYLNERAVMHLRTGAQTVPRDRLAFSIFEGLSSDQLPILEHYFNEKGIDSLLRHAARHEVRLLLDQYQASKDLHQRAALAEKIAPLKDTSALLKEANLHKSHLVFDMALSKAVKEEKIPLSKANEKMFIDLSAWRQADLERKAYLAEKHADLKVKVANYEAAKLKAVNEASLFLQVKDIEAPSLTIEKDMEIEGRFEATSAALYETLGVSDSKILGADPVFKSVLYGHNRCHARPHIAAHKEALSLEERAMAASSLLALDHVGGLLKENGLHKDHLALEVELSVAGECQVLDFRGDAKSVLPRLDAWRAVDLERRAMFKTYFEAKKLETDPAREVALQLNEEIVTRFEEVSHQLREDLIPHDDSGLEKNKSFLSVEKASQTYRARQLMAAHKEATSLEARSVAASSLLELEHVNALLRENGLHKDHLALEVALAEADASKAIHFKSEGEILLSHLDAWKAVDLERRAMFKTYFDAKKLETDPSREDAPQLNEEIVTRFEMVSHQLRTEIIFNEAGTLEEKSSLETNKSFLDLEKASEKQAERELVAVYQEATTFEARAKAASSLLERSSKDTRKKQGVFKQHLSLEADLHKALLAGQVTHENPDAVVGLLDAWKAADQDRRAMYRDHFKAQKEAGLSSDELVDFVADEGITKAFETSCRHLYDALSPQKSRLLKANPHFLKIIRTAEQEALKTNLERHTSATTLDERAQSASALIGLEGMQKILPTHGVFRDHLVLEETLHQAVMEKALILEGSHEPFLKALDGWKAADKDRRYMFSDIYKRLRAQDLEATPSLVASEINPSTVARFEKECSSFYTFLVGHKSPTLRANPLFASIENTILQNTKRYKENGRSAYAAPSVEAQPKRTQEADRTPVAAQKTNPRMSRHELNRFCENVLESLDFRSLAEDVLSRENKFYNRSLSNEQTARFGEKGSVCLTLSGPKAGMWSSFSEAVHGRGAFKFLEHYRGAEFVESLSIMQPHVSGSAALEIDRFLNHRQIQVDLTDSQERTQRQQAKEAQNQAETARLEKQKADDVKSLVAKTMALEGTQAMNYLKNERHLTKVSSPDLRYLEAGTRFTYNGKERLIAKGAMAALARDARGEVTALQLTYLDGHGARAKDQDGKKMPKFSYGSLTGAFVTLHQDPHGPTFLSEGVETGLSVHEAGFKGTFKAALGLQNMGHLPPQEQVLIILADYDGVGAKTHQTTQKMVAKLAEQHGQMPEVLWPAQEGAKCDFNDVLKEKGAVELQKILNQQRIHVEEKMLQTVLEASHEDTQQDPALQSKIQALACKIMRDPNLGSLLLPQFPSLKPKMLEAFHAYEVKHNEASHATLEVYQDRLQTYANSQKYHNLKEERALEEVAFRIAQNDTLMAQLEKNPPAKVSLKDLKQHATNYFEGLSKDAQAKVTAQRHEKIRRHDEQRFDPKKDALAHLQELHQLVKDNPEKLTIHKERIEKTAHAVLENPAQKEALLAQGNKDLTQFALFQREGHDTRHNLCDEHTLNRYIKWRQQYEASGAKHKELDNVLDQMAHRIMNHPDLEAKVHQHQDEAFKSDFRYRADAYVRFQLRPLQRDHGIGLER